MELAQAALDITRFKTTWHLEKFLKHSYTFPILDNITFLFSANTLSTTHNTIEKNFHHYSQNSLVFPTMALILRLLKNANFADLFE